MDTGKPTPKIAVNKAQETLHFRYLKCLVILGGTLTFARHWQDGDSFGYGASEPPQVPSEPPKVPLVVEGICWG